MRKTMIAVLGGLLLTVPAWAFQPTTATDSSQMAKQIEQLLELQPQERRAALKKMDPKERRGLWFQLKKEEQARKGVVPTARTNKAPIPVSVPADTPFLTKEEAIGTVAYDNGFPTVAFTGPELIGQRFDSHTGLPMLTSGTVSTVNALVVPGPANTTSSAGFVLLGPETTMGGAIALFSTFGVPTGVVATTSYTGLGVPYTGLSYFVLFGEFSNVYIPVFGPGTTMGQGHHAVDANTGGMGPNITVITPLTTLNAFIRTSGNIVPVELMTFEIE